MGGASNQKRLFQERADTSDKLCFNFCQFFLSVLSVHRRAYLVVDPVCSLQLTTDRFHLQRSTNNANWSFISGNE